MSDTTTVLHQHGNRITFRVDDVTPTTDRLATMSASARWKEQITKPLLTSSHAFQFQVVKECPYHPLVSGVHLAFSRHLPLTLTPDIIWLTIAQGFAQHVNNHAEDLRFHFVRHEGRKTLEATSYQLDQPEHWAAVIEQWSEGIRDHVGDELHSLLLCDFSTSTPTTRTASQVVMMDAFRQYFDYILYFICGIPEITLHGTVEDWQNIRERVRRLAEYDISWWTDRLLPICDGFVETAEGKPSQSFWQGIYMPKPTYGSELVTGWLGDLFPYIEDFLTKAPIIRNPLLDKPREAWIVKSEEEGLFAQGVSPERFPNGLSQAPATLHFVATGERRGLSFVGGFLGVTQEPESGGIGVEIGWAVHEQDDFSTALNTIIRDHEMEMPLQGVIANSQRYDEFPGELMRVLSQFDGGTLFSGTTHPWQFRKFQDYTTLPLEFTVAGKSKQEVTCFLDLADGRTVGYICVYWQEDAANRFSGWKHEWWIVVAQQWRQVIQVVDSDYDEKSDNQNSGISGLWGRIGRRKRRERPAPRFVDREIVVLLTDGAIVAAKGFAPFFQRLLEADGAYYFDEIGAGCPPWREAFAALKQPNNDV